MRMKIAALALLASVLQAHAQTPDFYVLKDQSSPPKTLQMGIFTTGGKSAPASVSSDAAGNPLSGTIGATNPNGTALFIQGVTGGIAVPTTITGPLPSFATPQTVNLGTIAGVATQATLAQLVTVLGAPLQAGGSVTIAGSLPSFASPQHFVCDSGCSGGGGGGVSATFGGAIGTLGTPNGYKDASGNFQPILGDTTFGQWVSIKQAVSLAVTGAFFQATQPISATSLPLMTGGATSALQTSGNASLATIATNTPSLGQALAAASVPVVLTAAQIATLTPLTSVAVTGSVTANAGPNLNTSLLALETGGNLASINTKTPALGQALAAASTPVVLTASQLTTLTPPAALTNFALETGGNLATIVTDIGALGSTACTTDNGSCNLNALVQRNNQRLTTINTTLGTPFQAGGSIGNTSFGITGSLNTGLDSISPSTNNAQIANFNYYLDPSSGIYTRARGNLTGAFVNGFAPAGVFATLTATGSSANAALPAGTTVYFQNLGTSAVSCTLGFNNTLTATTNENIIQPSSSFPMTVGFFTWAACIDQTGSASNLVALSGGSGLGNAFGGGSSGGGSSGAVFGPTAVGSANANPPVVIGGTATGAAGQNVQGLAVKPASTPAAATDQSAVTNESPNSQLSTAMGTSADAPCTLPATTTPCSQVALAKATANVANGPVTLGGATGGWTRTLFAGLSTTVQTVKSSAGQIAKLYCDNPNSSAIYVETFDVSGTVTLGTTAPTQAYYIPATNVGGFTLSLVGDQYANAIKIAAVTTENGSSAPATPGNCNVSWN